MSHPITQNFAIYHNKAEHSMLDAALGNTLRTPNFVLVALVTASNLDNAFDLTNSGYHEDDWRLNEGVIMAQHGDQRSTSMDDIIVNLVSNQAYKVLGTGFQSVQMRFV